MYKAKKRFGQNFLHDHNTISNIISAINIKGSDNILEIGPGRGALTKQILGKVGSLVTIELDRELALYLQQQFKEFGDKFVMHQGDILQFDLSTILSQEKKIRIIGNLPYNIGTQILFKLLEYRNSFIDLHCMMQKEVADRLIAVPGTKNYGRLSIMLQYFFDIKKLLIVKPSCFFPAPKVTSAFLSLVPRSTPKYLPIINWLNFQEVILKAFNQRRKTIANALITLVDKSTLIKLGFEPKLRPEQLSIDDYVILSNYITENF